jgi:alpha-N-arabinofuranosidase
VLFHGRGRLWLDQVSLLPGNAVDGVRADVFQKIKALRPAFVRWPGGNVAQDYHWMWGIGPRDQRTSWVNLSWANESEPSDFGTDEFIQFCRNLGAEPSLTVNVEGRGASSEEAAAWVEYANGSSNSKFGALRAANGHPEPFRVKYWEVGNEIWGTWVRAHSDAETYARNFNRYATAMRAVDPSIRLIAVGDNDMSWDRTVLRIAGANLDYLAIHHYYGTAEMGDDARNLMAHPLQYEAFYAKVEQSIHELAPGRDIRLNINEWNSSLPLPRQHSMESALYAARLMNIFERNQAVIYRGPFREVLDDDNHRMERGVRYAVCDKTYNLYRKAPYREFFEFVEPLVDISVGEARPFDCSHTARRHPKETKGQDYSVTTEASSCCDGGSC